MKTLLILLIFISTGVFAQNVSSTQILEFETEEITLNALFKSVESQSDYTFAYVANDEELKQKINLKSKNLTLHEVCDLLSKEYNYEVNKSGNQVFIKQGKEEVSLSPTVIESVPVLNKKETIKPKESELQTINRKFTSILNEEEPTFSNISIGKVSHVFDDIETDGVMNYFSVYYKRNWASQTHSYPDITNFYLTHPNYSFSSSNGDTIPNEKTFGKHAERNLKSWGIGMAYQHELRKWLAIKGQLNYIQKGCSSYGDINTQDSDGREEVIYYSYTNRFHYISIDAIAVFKVGKWKVIQPYFYTGLRNDFLLDFKVEYDIDMMNDPSGYTGLSREDKYFLGDGVDPSMVDKSKFNRYTIGMVNGIGFTIKQAVYIEFDLNHDLSYLVKSDILKVRNSMMSVNVGINLGHIFPYRIKLEKKTIDI